MGKKTQHPGNQAYITHNNTPLVIPLKSLSKTDLPLAGGKAVNLGELISRKFPVPDGFLITTGAYRQFLQSQGLGEQIVDILKSSGGNHRAASAGVTELIMGKPVPGAVADAARESLSRLGEDKPVAIRSSATAEDLKDASFAGIHDTYLNICGIEDVLKHLRLCWASLWSERAMAYRDRAGIEHMKADMAVVVQRMLRPEVSGVMFTTNPLTAHPGEIVIEAARGLGEGVVSGEVQPDNFVLRKSTGEIKRYRPSDESHSETTTREPCLPAEDLKALAGLGHRLERELGSRQDVEWAIEKAPGDSHGRIALLQSRPITTLPPEDKPVFTRKMGDQYWTDVIAPFTFTCGVDWIVEGTFKPMVRAFGLKNLAELDFFRLYKSHLYMNTRMAREGITMFPRSARKQFTDSMGSPHDDDYFLEAPYRPLRGLISMIKAHLNDKHSGMSRNLRSLKDWGRSIKDRTDRLLRRLEDSPSIDELMKMFDEVDRMGIEHFEIIRWGHASYSTALTDTLRAMCESWADDTDGSLFLRITGYLGESATMKTDQALWETAREIGNDSQARELLLTLPPEEAAQRILEGNEFPAARQALRSFLDDYGHRTTSRDITVPHWREAPGQVVSVIKGILAEEMPASPREKSEAARRRTEQALTEALACIRRKWYGTLVRRWFVRTAEQARIFIGYRENQRFTLDRIMLLMRRLVIALGDWLVKEGQLDHPEDAFYLERNELTAAVRARHLAPDIRRQIPDRRRELKVNRDRLPPTYIIGSFEFEIPEAQKAALPPGVYSGLNAAPGIIDGPARVLTELVDSHELREGDILVTESTDPAWGAAFMKVAGLVMETGGLLSHGAILAREFGVPAVTHVSGATHLIRTGDLLRVDGTRGRVTVLSTKEGK
ncbi:MAG: hypothetical protein JSU92_06650 [Deltaproteobacteria bacterium]|nr:MAG: hypothetical protein JSU92_06650 [Deltaproteobacteria bacterium]